MSLLAKFFGLTVKDVGIRLGWGSQPGELTIQLVQDVRQGDVVAPVEVGFPAYFQIGNLFFGGLLRRWSRSDSVDGFPTWEAQIVDAREILESATLITGGYGGTVNLFNLFNVFGYWEAKKFGESQSNSAGMPWYKIQNALLKMVNQTFPDPYGIGLAYRGKRYALDLSELPVTPAYYRLPAGHVNLLEAISQVCEDAGYDFFVELKGQRIKIRTVSRYRQPPIDTFSRMLSLAAHAGQVSRTESAVESRNEITSAFLVGGDLTTLHLTSAIASFWGNDIAGKPIIGVASTHADIGACEKMEVNASPVADILGAVKYETNTIEIRCALANYDVWSLYIRKYKKDTVGKLIYAPWDPQVVTPETKNDIVVDGVEQVASMASDIFWQRSHRLYEFLHGIATEYYGKQFLVRIPFVLSATDKETLQVTYSQEPTDSAWIDGGAASLGINTINQDVVQTPDERVLPFVYFPGVYGADTSRLSWTDSAVDHAGALWSRATLSNKIVFIGSAIPVPCAHIRLASVLYDKPLDEFGGLNIINPLLVNKAETIADKGMGGTIGLLSCHPAARYPSAVGVPLRSNVRTYGPWFAIGADGRVRYEQDDSLTPWDYGSTKVMNLAGAVRVNTAITNTLRSVAGSFLVPGLPGWNLGDILVGGGPNLTSVNVRYGAGGVTTEYRFDTFTPRFGLFSRQNAERLKRASLATVEMRRLARKSLAKALRAVEAYDAAYRGWKANKPLLTRKESPQDVLVAESFRSANNDVRVVGGVDKYEAGVLVQQSKQGRYTEKAMMSWPGLIRPFTTDVNATGTLSKYSTGGSGLTTPVVATGLNPFQSGNDIEVLAWGNTYAGAHAYRRGATPTQTRAIGLRGPLVIAGWGFDVSGNRTPSATGYLRGSDNWKTGPLDPLWDDKRGVWTVHDVITGCAQSDIAAGSSGTFLIGGTGSTWTMLVKNPFATKVPASAAAEAVYSLNENLWVISRGNEAQLSERQFKCLGTGTTISCSGGSVVLVKEILTITVAGENVKVTVA